MIDFPSPPPRVGVIGAGTCSPDLSRVAREAGRLIARWGAILVCGGLGGVMEAAAKGAREEGGFTVGVLPSGNPATANPYIILPVPTGMGHARNVVVVQTSQVVIAIGGQAGTLSELAIALKLGIPIIGFKTWDVDPRIRMARSGEELALAIEKALKNL